MFRRSLSASSTRHSRKTVTSVTNPHRNYALTCGACDGIPTPAGLPSGGRAVRRLLAELPASSLPRQLGHRRVCMGDMQSWPLASHSGRSLRGISLRAPHQPSERPGQDYASQPVEQTNGQCEAFSRWAHRGIHLAGGRRRTGVRHAHLWWRAPSAHQ